MFAPLVSCLLSWSAMLDVCVTCAKKCAVTMGANVLKEPFKSLRAARKLSTSMARKACMNRSCLSDFCDVSVTKSVKLISNFLVFHSVIFLKNWLSSSHTQFLSITLYLLKSVRANRIY